MSTAAAAFHSSSQPYDLDGLDLIPPQSARPEDTDRLIEWLKRRVYTNSPLYNDDYSRWRKAELYDATRQWVRRAKSASDSTFDSQWSGLVAYDRDGNTIPLPVYNEGVLHRENESARLGRPEYKPRVRPSSTNPGIKEKDGAKGAERALMSRIKDMFSDQEDKLYLHMPLYGGSWLKSYWDQTWTETVRIPQPALACPYNPKTQKAIAPPTAPPTAPASPMSGAGQPPGAAPAGPLSTPPVEEIPSPSPASAGQPLGSSPPFTAPPPAPMQPAMQPPMQPAGIMPAAQPPGMGMGDQTSLFPSIPPMPPPPPPTCDFACPANAPPEYGVCPMHPDQQLVPYQPTLEEAATTDLGVDIPKGDWFMRVLYPYQVFVADEGIDQDPTDVNEWLEMYTRRLSWAEERWPDKIRDERGLLRVHPENAAVLMKQNPTLGSPDILKHIQTTKTMRSHVTILEYHRKPWMEWKPTPNAPAGSGGRYEKNKGRSIFALVGASGKGVIALDGPYMIPSLNKPNTEVARARLEFVAWELMDGGRRACTGQSMWDRMFDPQDGINERASQTRSVNQRTADPLYIERKGANLEMAGDSAIPTRRVRADIDPADRMPPLMLLNNEVINPGVYDEIAFNSAYLKKMQVEVEAGQVPPGVAAATAIAYLKTEAGEKRRPRILRIRRALVRAWNHGLQLMSAMYIEPREYDYEDENGDERTSFIEGDVIAQSNPKVDIYPTPDYDITDARRESIRDMVQLGILDPRATPQLSRKIVGALDETLDFFLDDDMQEQQAQREWRDFKDKQRRPVTDPSLDDDETHYQCHGRDCFTEWFRQAEDDARWDEVLKVIGGDWDAMIEKVKMMLLSPAIPGMPKPAADDALMALWMQQITMHDQAMQTAMMMDGQLPAMPPGVTPVSKPFLPNHSLEEVVLPWRAHMEAHRIKAEVKLMKKAMQQAAAAAPATGSEPGAEQGGGEAPGQGSQPGEEQPASAGAPAAGPQPSAPGAPGAAPPQA